jgi:hypothetical protein
VLLQGQFKNWKLIQASQSFTRDRRRLPLPEHRSHLASNIGTPESGSGPMPPTESPLPKAKFPIFKEIGLQPQLHPAANEVSGFCTPSGAAGARSAERAGIA